MGDRFDVSAAVFKGLEAQQQKQDVELRIKVNTYLSSLHCSTWGRMFVLADSHHQLQDAQEFLYKTIKGVLASGIDEHREVGS